MFCNFHKTETNKDLFFLPRPPSLFEVFPWTFALIGCYTRCCACAARRAIFRCLCFRLTITNGSWPSLCTGWRVGTLVHQKRCNKMRIANAQNKTTSRIRRELNTSPSLWCACVNELFSRTQNINEDKNNNSKRTGGGGAPPAPFVFSRRFKYWFGRSRLLRAANRFFPFDLIGGCWTDWVALDWGPILATQLGFAAHFHHEVNR